MSNDPIRIILVDDHKLIRESWKLLFENNPQFDLIAICEDGASAIEQAQKLFPEIMLIDINMSPLNGFEVTERILKINPSIKIIGLSINNQPFNVDRILGLGARGYITKTSSLEEIYYGIIEVHKGEYYISKEAKRKDPPEENGNRA